MMAASLPEREDAMEQVNSNLITLFDALRDLIDVYPFWRMFFVPVSASRKG